MRVLVLFGGRSGEHEVSVLSARSIVDALEALGHVAVTVGITLDGRWVMCHPHAADRVLESGGEPFTFTIDPQAPRDVDVVFPVFHGPYGEDGSLQGLFELADIPYVGSGVEGSAIGLNKWVHRSLFREAGIPVVKTYAFVRTAWDRDPDVWTQQIADLGFPAFVKPAHLGSSVGISRVASAAEIALAMERAFQHDDLVLVEAFGGTREIEVGVIDGAPPAVSVVGEIVPAGDFYDYDSKYLTADTQLTIPAQIPSDVADRVRELAIKAFGIARAEGFARIDFFWEPSDDALFVNEINTIPGMTASSMFPKVWEASGVPFDEVVGRLLDHAVARHERKMKLEAARQAAHDGEVGQT